MSGREIRRHFAAGILALFCVIGLSAFSFAEAEPFAGSDDFYPLGGAAQGFESSFDRGFFMISEEEASELLATPTDLAAACSSEQRYVFLGGSFRMISLATGTDLVSNVYISDSELNLGSDGLIASLLLPDAEISTPRLRVNYTPSQYGAMPSFAVDGVLVSFDMLSSAGISENEDGSYTLTADLDCDDLRAISFHTQEEYGCYVFSIVSGTADETGAVPEIVVHSVEFSDLNGGFGIARRLSAEDAFDEHIAELEIFTANGGVNLIDMSLEDESIELLASDPGAVSVGFISEDFSCETGLNPEDIGSLLAQIPAGGLLSDPDEPSELPELPELMKPSGSSEAVELSELLDEPSGEAFVSAGGIKLDESRDEIAVHDNSVSVKSGGDIKAKPDGIAAESGSGAESAKASDKISLPVNKGEAAQPGGGTVLAKPEGVDAEKGAEKDARGASEDPEDAGRDNI